MGDGMTRYHFHVGRDVALVHDDAAGVEVEGPRRLPPGRVVRLTGMAATGTDGRLAIVTRWRVTHIGNSGPFYRGYCEWLHLSRSPPVR